MQFFERLLRFLLKLVFFGVSAIALYVLLHSFLNWGHQHMRTRHDPNGVYVLGDSRVVYGIDRTALSELTQRPVHAYAAEGAGIYALYALAEKIPDNTDVLIAPTLGMFMKPEKRIEWRSGLSLRGMRLLLQEGYSLWAVKRVLATNRDPLSTPYLRQPVSFPVEPEPRWIETPDYSLYVTQKERPEIFARNQVLFRDAVEALLARGCRVKVIDIPVTDRMRKFREESIYGNVFSEITALSDDSLKLEKYQDVVLEKRPDENLFYDFDHLNKLGAKRMSEYVAKNVVSGPSVTAAQNE